MSSRRHAPLLTPVSPSYPSQVGPPVSDWAVRSVPLHRESRHKDVTAVLDMYKHLDTFLQVGGVGGRGRKVGTGTPFSVC